MHVLLPRLLTVRNLGEYCLPAMGSECKPHTYSLYLVGYSYSTIPYRVYGVIMDTIIEVMAYVCIAGSVLGFIAFCGAMVYVAVDTIKTNNYVNAARRSIASREDSR